MISTQRYFIHIDNGSVVPWTSEIEDNYKFKEITSKVAMAIERGVILSDEVISQITKKIKSGTLDEMLEAKLKMNVREGELNLEKQVSEDNTQKDVGKAAPYDVTVPKRDVSVGKAERRAKADAGHSDAESEPSGEVERALNGGVNV